MFCGGLSRCYHPFVLASCNAFMCGPLQCCYLEPLQRCNSWPLQSCHPKSLKRCLPDRSGGISRHWQRLRPWIPCSGDPSAALRMTGLGAIPSRYKAVFPSRYKAVIYSLCERPTISPLAKGLYGFARTQHPILNTQYSTKRSLVATLCRDDKLSSSVEMTN